MNTPDPEIISISSDSEVEEPAVPVHIPPRKLVFVSDSIPVYWIPKDIRHYMLYASFNRLQVAKSLQIPIDELFIGPDTILCWPTYHWDPEYESLHCNIQAFLLRIQLSHEMGSAIRSKLLSINNERLEQAKQCGLCTQDLQIGHDMCITWVHRIEMENIVSYDSSTDSDYDIAESPNTTVSRGMQATSSDSETSSHIEMDCDYEWDIYNMTDQMYDEPKAVTNVRIGGMESDMVDLEVYMAEDTDESLPEIEMAIDAAGFEKYYGSVDVMDVECDFDVTNTVDGGVVADADVSDTDMSEVEKEHEEPHPEGWFYI